MKDTIANKIVIAERDNIAAVIENGKVAEFFVHRGDIILGDVYLCQVENILPSIELNAIYKNMNGQNEVDSNIINNEEDEEQILKNIVIERRNHLCQKENQ